MAAIVGSLLVRLAADSGPLSSALRVAGHDVTALEGKTTKSLARMDRDYSSRFASMGKSATGAVASMGRGGLAGAIATLGASFTLGAIRDTARGIAEIGDEAKRAGVDLGSFQELKFVAEQNRIGVDSLTDGLKELNLRADEFIATGGGSAAEAFQRIGYDAESLREKLKTPSALFSEIIGKLGQLDRAAQIRVADEIFGGAGGEKFVQLIAQSEAGIAATIEQARSLGVVMDAELIDKADRTNRAFNAIATSVETRLKSAIVEAADALNSFLNSLGQTPSEHFTELETRVAGLRAEMEEFYQATIRTAPESAASIRLIIDEVNSSGLSADEASAKLRAMAAIDMSLFPITSGLSGVIALLDHVGSKARAAAAEVAAATLSSAGTMPEFGELTAFAKPALKPAPIVPRSSGSGGSGKSVDSERKAVSDLIAELVAERGALSQNNAERRVAEELRKAGATATESERAQIVSLVTAIETEGAALETLQAHLAEAEGLAKDFASSLVGDVLAGENAVISLTNAFGKLGQKLVQMAADKAIEALFGNVLGSITGSLGTIGIGGVTAPTRGFTPGLTGPKLFAGGGAVVGRGSGRSDSIMARLSNGEFVVNAQSTRAFRPLLEAINSGAPGFASGGLVAPRLPTRTNLAPFAKSVGGNATGKTTTNFNIDARGAQRGVGEEIREALEQYDKRLPDRMNQISRDPRKRK